MKLQGGELFWEISDDTLPNLTSWLTINRACNLRCQWCYSKMTGYRSDDSMTLETVGDSVVLLKGLGLESVILIGGEPTIHPHFFEIVETIKKSGLNVYLVTNGVKFSDKYFLERTLEAGVSSITISFKAANREMFYKNTGLDLFLESFEATKNIVSSGVLHVVNITACSDLMNNFDELIEVVKRTGTDKFSIDTGKPIFLDGESYADGMGTPREIADFFISVYPKLEKSGLRFSVKIAVPFCLFPRYFVDKMIEDGNILTGCQMVSGRGIIIDPGGKLLPCNHLCDLSLGRINNDFCDAAEFLTFRKRDVGLRIMNTKFIYNKEIDVKCWRRYNNFIKKNKTVWGITKNIKPIIEINSAKIQMSVDDIIEKYIKIFGMDINIKGYIVTTPFSMINDDGKFIKDGIVYYSIYTANPSVVMAHELFHIYFEKYTKRKISNYDEAKEYFTVIINDIFHSDVSKGYPIHQKIRKAILEKWKTTHSIDECVRLLERT